MQKLKAELAKLEQENTELATQIGAAQAPTADTLKSYSGLLNIDNWITYDGRISR
jgi:hypothetical protein